MLYILLKNTYMSNKRINTEKGKLEKFYTSGFILDELVKELKEKINLDETTEFLENSAGDGKIIDALKVFEKPIIAYDIIPHRDDIIEGDYLKEKIEYKKGRVCVMNPPFSKGLKFLYKALDECDYVVSILSINSLLNIDYSKVWIVGDIKLYRKIVWDDTKISVIILTSRLKKEGDKYEYDR